MLEIVTPGIARVEGNLLMANARAGRTASRFTARERLEVATPTGSVRVRDARRRAGRHAAARLEQYLGRLAGDHRPAARQSQLCRPRRRPARQWRHRGAARLCRGGRRRRWRPAARSTSRTAARPALQPRISAASPSAPAGSPSRRPAPRRQCHRLRPAAQRRTAASPIGDAFFFAVDFYGRRGRRGGQLHARRRVQHLHHRHRPVPARRARRSGAGRRRSDHRPDRRLGRDPAAGRRRARTIWSTPASPPIR